VSESRRLRRVLRAPPPLCSSRILYLAVRLLAALVYLASMSTGCLSCRGLCFPWKRSEPRSIGAADVHLQTVSVPARGPASASASPTQRRIPAANRSRTDGSESGSESPLEDDDGNLVPQLSEPGVLYFDDFMEPTGAASQHTSSRKPGWETTSAVGRIVNALRALDEPGCLVPLRGLPKIPSQQHSAAQPTRPRRPSSFLAADRRKLPLPLRSVSFRAVARGGATSQASTGVGSGGGGTMSIAAASGGLGASLAAPSLTHGPGSLTNLRRYRSLPALHVMLTDDEVDELQADASLAERAMIPRVSSLESLLVQQSSSSKYLKEAQRWKKMLMRAASVKAAAVREQVAVAMGPAAAAAAAGVAASDQPDGVNAQGSETSSRQAGEQTRSSHVAAAAAAAEQLGDDTLDAVAGGRGAMVVLMKTPSGSVLGPVGAAKEGVEANTVFQFRPVDGVDGGLISGDMAGTSMQPSALAAVRQAMQAPVSSVGVAASSAPFASVVTEDGRMAVSRPGMRASSPRVLSSASPAQLGTTSQRITSSSRKLPQPPPGHPRALLLDDFLLATTRARIEEDAGTRVAKNVFVSEEYIEDWLMSSVDAMTGKFVFDLRKELHEHRV
jgi:hypothetical protein